MGKIYATFFILSLFSMSVSVVSAEEEESLIDHGREVFIENRCYQCHTVNAEAEKIEKEKIEFAKERGLEIKEEAKEEEEEKKGGDLSHIGKVKDAEFIRGITKNPKDYFKDNSECQREAKKKYRKRFKGTEEELETLVAYISSLKYDKQEEKKETCIKD